MTVVISTFPSPSARTVPNVTTTSVQIADVNAQRTGLYVFNSSSVTIWVAPGATPAVASGAGSISIAAGTGTMFGPPNTPAWTNSMNAIAASAGTNQVVVHEYTS